MTDLLSAAEPTAPAELASVRRSMSQIVFENRGEIDVRTITTFGVSVKEGDSPIGYFGTGLKYAIAVLLRHDHKISIHSGLSAVAFGVRHETVRGQEFDFVTMSIDGEAAKDAGFTTQLGRNWQLWMAYRELACNCKDEAGYASRQLGDVEPREDFTFVAVEGDAFAAIHSESWKYLLEDEAESAFNGIEVRNYESDFFFYRGVRVHHLPRHAMLTYNALDQIELTEDRTVKDGYAVPFRISKCLLRCEDEKLLRRVLSAPEKYLEHHLDYHGWGTQPSAAFLRVCGELAVDRSVTMNKTAQRVWEESTKAEFSPRVVNLTAVQQMSLDKALIFCERLGFPIRESYPVSVVESLGSDALGLAKDGHIYISERAFHLGGAKQVASALIEEYIHLKLGYGDMTRELQSWLFEKVVSLGEELAGEPL